VLSDKAWVKLGGKISSNDESLGIILLAVLKLADIDGHEEIEDVVWFFDLANSTILRKRGRWLPVPTVEDVRRLQ
jgi:hypothetical protein